MPNAPQGTSAILATITAARKRLDQLAHQHLPFERALVLELEHRRHTSLEHELLDLVGGILDREVDIWRRSFAARIAHQPPAPPAAASDAADFVPPPRPPHAEVAPTPAPAPAPIPEPVAPPRSYLLNPADPEQDITLTDADRVQAILDAGDEPPLTDTDALDLSDADPPQVLADEPEPTVEPAAVEETAQAAPPSPSTLEDELDRLVLEELERAREELNEPATDEAALHDDQLIYEDEEDDSGDLFSDEVSDEDAPPSVPPASEEEEAALRRLLESDDLISFEDDEDDEDDFQPHVPADALSAGADSDLVSFGDDEDEDAGSPEAGAAVDDEDALPQDMQHLLSGDDLVSFGDDEDEDAAPAASRLLEPNEAVLAAASIDPIFDDLLVEEDEPAPEEEATVMAPTPLAAPRVVSSPMVRAAMPDEPEEDSEEDSAPAVSWSRQGLSDRLGSELEEDVAPRAAAVQLMGSGQARTLGNTLELESAEDLPVDADDEAVDDWGSDGDGLSVTLEEEEYEEEQVLPRLTEAAAPTPIIPADVQPRQAPTRADVSRALKKALDIEQSGDMQQAILLYGDVIDLDPLSIEARMGRGRCLMELSDYAAAMSDFQKAEDLRPGAPGPAYEMGNLFYARKDYRRAIEFYTQSLSLDANQAMALVRRGMSHHYRREYNEALDDLNRAKQLDPDIPGLTGLIKKTSKALLSS